MSTDLQLRQDLPAIKLPASLKIKLPASPSLMDSTSEESCAIQLEDQEVEECRTPTTIQHRIPQLISCPPPPKKQRPSPPSCRRRLSEFDFIESVARDEIESFFRSSYEIINEKSSTKKRRCSRL